MIDVKEKHRRPKRKFEESIENNGCPIVQPKETILDMSVSKLAKAKTRLNLEPSLRKTVMIVNTIRKIEQEIESGKLGDANEDMSVDHCAVGGKNTRCNSTLKVSTYEETTDSTDIVPVRMNMTLERRNEHTYNEDNSGKLDKMCRRSFGVSGVTLTKSDETFIDLTQTTHQHKSIFMNKCSSTCITAVPSYNKLPDMNSEINFAEIDISLYDFDATLSWSEGSIQIACAGDIDDNDSVYKTNTGLSALFRRCSDDFKFNKTTDNSFTDDLDQIMQVLVGI